MIDRACRIAACLLLSSLILFPATSFADIGEDIKVLKNKKAEDTDRQAAANRLADSFDPSDARGFKKIRDAFASVLGDKRNASDELRILAGNALIPYLNDTKAQSALNKTISGTKDFVVRQQLVNGLLEDHRNGEGLAEATLAALADFVEDAADSDELEGDTLYNLVGVFAPSATTDKSAADATVALLSYEADPDVGLAAARTLYRGMPEHGVEVSKDLAKGLLAVVANGPNDGDAVQLDLAAVLMVDYPFDTVGALVAAFNAAAAKPQFRRRAIRMALAAARLDGERSLEKLAKALGEMFKGRDPRRLRDEPTRGVFVTCLRTMADLAPFLRDSDVNALDDAVRKSGRNPLDDPYLFVAATAPLAEAFVVNDKRKASPDWADLAKQVDRKREDMRKERNAPVFRGEVFVLAQQFYGAAYKLGVPTLPSMFAAIDRSATGGENNRMARLAAVRALTGVSLRDLDEEQAREVVRDHRASLQGPARSNELQAFEDDSQGLSPQEAAHMAIANRLLAVVIDDPDPKVMFAAAEALSGYSGDVGPTQLGYWHYNKHDHLGELFGPALLAGMLNAIAGGDARNFRSPQELIDAFGEFVAAPGSDWNAASERLREFLSSQRLAPWYEFARYYAAETFFVRLADDKKSGLRLEPRPEPALSPYGRTVSDDVAEKLVDAEAIDKLFLDFLASLDEGDFDRWYLGPGERVKADQANDPNLQPDDRGFVTVRDETRGARRLLVDYISPLSGHEAEKSARYLLAAAALFPTGDTVEVGLLEELAGLTESTGGLGDKPLAAAMVGLAYLSGANRYDEPDAVVERIGSSLAHDSDSDIVRSEWQVGVTSSVHHFDLKNESERMRQLLTLLDPAADLQARLELTRAMAADFDKVSPEVGTVVREASMLVLRNKPGRQSVDDEIEFKANLAELVLSAKPDPN